MGRYLGPNFCMARVRIMECPQTADIKSVALLDIGTGSTEARTQGGERVRSSEARTREDR